MDVTSYMLGKKSSGGGSSTSNTLFIKDSDSDDTKKGVINQALAIYQSGINPIVMLLNVANVNQTPVTMTVSVYYENNGSGGITFTGTGIAQSTTNMWNGINYNAVRHYTYQATFTDNTVSNLTVYDEVSGYLMHDIMQANPQDIVYDYDMDTNQINLNGNQLISKMEYNWDSNIRIRMGAGGVYNYFNLVTVYDLRNDPNYPMVSALFQGEGELEMISAGADGTAKFTNASS